MPRRPTPIIGVRAIAEYMGMSPRTVLTLLHHHDFPGCRLPDYHRRWMTTTSLIDRWILQRRYTQMKHKSAVKTGTRVEPKRF